MRPERHGALGHRRARRIPRAGHDRRTDGRGPGNSFAHDLLIIKDQGAFIYNPGDERERAVEIQSEEDYPKLLSWYRRGMQQILDHRPDIDWALRAPGAPNASLFGPYQFNLNRDGQTWFIPITDVGWLYFSVMLNLFDAWHLYFTDDKTGEPAGVGPWVKEGQLEFPVTISQIEQFIFQVETYPPGSYVQNMRLAAEAMGLGNWVFCGYFDDILMGAFPDLAQGLGFRAEPLNERAPAASGALKIFGLEGIKEATYVPSPRYMDGRAVMTAMMEEKYGEGRTMSRGDDNWMLRHGGPFTADTVRAIVNDPATHVSDWAVEACIAYVDYCVEHYGQCPAYFNPMQCNFGAVVHHVDPAFYERYYDGSTVTPAIRRHMQEWHCRGCPRRSGTRRRGTVRRGTRTGPGRADHQAARRRAPRCHLAEVAGCRGRLARCAVERAASGERTARVWGTPGRASCHS